MRIYLGGSLNFYIPGHSSWVEVHLETPTHLNAVLENLGIPQAEVYVTAVNGEAVDPAEVVVHDGDEVKLYPPVSGG